MAARLAFSDASIATTCARLPSVLSLMLVGLPGSAVSCSPGWTSFTMAMKSSPSTSHSECTSVTCSRTLWSRSVCKGSTICVSSSVSCCRIGSLGVFILASMSESNSYECDRLTTGF